MRVLVIGATGHVGSAIAERFKEAGHEVVGLARSENSAGALRSSGFEAVVGDLRRPEGFSGAVRGADAMVYAAAPEGSDAADVDRGAVESILDELSGTGRTFIYTSGGWVMGGTNGEVADEESPLDPPPGMEWRPAAEELVMSASEERGIRTLVVRPALVYGAPGSVVGELVEWAGHYGTARYVKPPGEECYWTLIHREDLGRFYVRLAEEARLPGGELLIAAGRKPLLTRDIAAEAGRTASVGEEVEAWPLNEAREELGTYADSLALSQKLSGSRAEDLLGWRPMAPSVFEELEHGSYAKD